MEPHELTRNPGWLGLGIAKSITRAMGFSYLSSFFSESLGNVNFFDALRLFVAGTVIETGRRFCRWAFERFKIRYSITAQFDEGDPACDWLVNYLTQEDVWKRSRDFLVSAKSSQLKWGIKLQSTESAEYVPKYSKPHLFRWKGYWVEIQKVERSYDPANIGYPPAPGSSYNSILLTMYTLNVDALSKLVEEARSRYIEGRRPHVIVHSIDISMGNTWNVVKRKNRRPLDSIVLPHGLLTSLAQDVKDFLNSEHWYTRAGIPYRRGYLLYGPPGTGKTSTIYALAGELGLEIYTMSLSSGFVDDSTLQRAVSSLPKHSIFLLEDIDCAFPSRDDEQEQEMMNRRYITPGNIPPRGYSNVTMSGLLNVLDGVGSEDGKLFFATTNYIDRLDAALLRPGRIDLRIGYKLATKAQAVALFNRFYPRHGEVPEYFFEDSEKRSDAMNNMAPISADELGRLSAEFASHIPDDEFTTAELQGYLLLCRKSPGEAVDKIDEWIKVERAEKQRRKEAEAEAADRRNKMQAANAFAGPPYAYSYPYPAPAPAPVPSPVPPLLAAPLADPVENA